MQEGVPENRQLPQVGICVLRRACDALCACWPCGVLGMDGADPLTPLTSATEPCTRTKTALEGGIGYPEATDCSGTISKNFGKADLWGT